MANAIIVGRGAGEVHDHRFRWAWSASIIAEYFHFKGHFSQPDRAQSSAEPVTIVISNC
ncbi:MAG: hypothetical protein ACRD2U_13470 [Terriglobales bacterium]